MKGTPEQIILHLIRKKPEASIEKSALTHMTRGQYRTIINKLLFAGKIRTSKQGFLLMM